MHTSRQTLRIGLAVGHGTGPELAAIFQLVIGALSQKFNIPFEIIRSHYTYNTYHTLTASATGKDLIGHIASQTTKDAAEYYDFCQMLARDGVLVVFRTAIHAQSLYQVREQLQAVKVEHFRSNDNDKGSLLLIRDEAQGFYTGTNQYGKDKAEVIRKSTFRLSIFDKILCFALSRATQLWGPPTPEEAPRSLILAYKFHLFDGVFQAWAPHWKSKFGVDIDFVQPDTMSRNLMAKGLGGRRLIIVAGNEYGDIIQPIFHRWFGGLTPEAMYAENIYLELGNLIEYQTIHGSADAIAGQGLVNPFATIRAAAAIIEQQGGGVGAQAEVEKALRDLENKKLTTADQGGALGTDDVMKHFLHALGTACLQQRA